MYFYQRVYTPVVRINLHFSYHSQELFISYLTQQTHKKSANKKDLNYNDLSDFVQAEDKLEFLHQIVPKKITVKEFREILERGSSDSESESDASSGDENDSEIDDDLDEGSNWQFLSYFFHMFS